jgi:hypothetical protein
MICKVLMAWKAQGVDDLVYKADWRYISGASSAAATFHWHTSRGFAGLAILQRDILGRWRDLPLAHQEGVCWIGNASAGLPRPLARPPIGTPGGG